MEYFWKNKALTDLSHDEWESLCDGCGLCCLQKWVLRKTVQYTCVACELLDTETGFCRDYANRHTIVKDCVELTPKILPEASQWLPETCAYKRLYLGQDLPSWHYLISGSKDAVITQGIGVHGRTVNEQHATDDQLNNSVVLAVSTTPK